jgi:signal transduction histidine kinase
LITRLGLRARLLIGLFLIVSVSLGLVAGQAVALFQQDKTSYVFDLNASRALKIADDVQANVRHLTEKMRIFSEAVRLPLPEGTDRRALLSSMLRQYPEFLLYSVREPDGTLRNVFLSGALARLGLTVEGMHAAYGKADLPLDAVTPERPLIRRLGLNDRIPTFTLAVRAPAEGEQPGQVLIAELPLARLYDPGGESRLFEVHVTDEGGRPLVSSAATGAPAPASASGNPASGPPATGATATGAGGAASGGTPGPAGDASPGPAAGAASGAASGSFADLLPKSALTAGTREYVAAGVPMLTAYAPVGNLGLWTVVQIPKARAFEAARRLVARSLVIAGVVCAAAVGLVFLFAAGLTRSLGALMKATEQIGQGQFKVAIAVSGGGEIGALSARFRKMTDELAAREVALQEANRRLIEGEKMTAIGQLGAGIAHEVKNPMTSIRGYAQMGLRKVSPESPLHEYFKTIERETGRSLEILKNLLRFARQETADLSRIDLNAVVADTVKLCGHQLQMKQVEVSTDLHEEPLEVNGNANQMEQVLLNLIMNAGDALEGIGGKVAISTDAAGRQAVIRVADTGPGIPPEVQKRIFEPFFTTKPVGKGTGLGLSVSYGIVKDHKGEIVVHSERGRGTTFTITIPLLPAETPAVAAEAPAAPEPEAAAGGAKRVRVIRLR